MATKYWVGGGSSGNWNATANTNWSNSSGGANNATVPASGDTIIFNGNGANAQNNCTLTAGVTMANIDFTGYTGTFTHNASVTLTLRNSTGLTFVSGMGYTLGNATSSAIQFTRNTGSPTPTFATGGKTFGNITINAASTTVTLSGNLTSTGTLTLTSGTFNANGNTVTANIFSSSGSTTRVLTMGNGQWTITGTGDVWTTATSTNLTLNAGSAGVDFTDSSATAKTYYITVNPGPVKMSAGSGNHTLKANTLCASLDLTGSSGTNGWGAYTVGITGNLTLAGTWTGTGDISLGGNLTYGSGMTSTCTSTITYTATSGPKTITSNSVTNNNAHVFNGVGGSWQMGDAFVSTKAGTLTNGSLNGNTYNMTFLTFASNNSNTRTLTTTNSAGSTGKLILTGNAATVLDLATTTNLTLAYLDDSSNVIPIEFTYSGSTGTRTIAVSTSAGSILAPVAIKDGDDTVALGASILHGLDCTGFTGTMTVGDMTVMDGDITLDAGMEITAGTSTITWVETSVNTRTLTSNGVNIGNHLSIGDNTDDDGTYVFADALNLGTKTLAIDGCFVVDPDGNNVTIGNLVATGASNDVSFGAETWELTGVGTLWATIGDPYNNGTTVKITNDSASAKDFSGNAGVLWVATGDTGTTTVSGQCVTFKITQPDGTGRPIIVLAGGAIVFDALDIDGTVGQLNTFESDTDGVEFYMIDNSPPTAFVVEYLSLKDSNADISGGSTWTANFSDNVSGNTNWIFTGGTAIKTVLGLAIASVKTFNGLVIASVKSINGLE